MPNLFDDTAFTWIDLAEQSSTPATPSAGTVRRYAKTDHKLYRLDSTGAETGDGSGGGTHFSFFAG